ncbi:MAG: PD-(D/E)XK motif protein [Nevskiaceae bacterium]|nr:MAG: PD-(D/E)XK motif protein [Nevskiaceae bacterium]
MSKPMAKTTKIEALWNDSRDKSKSAPIAEGDFKLVRIDATSPADIYAAIDGHGNLMIVVGVQSKPPTLTLKSSSLDYFRVQRYQGFAWLMALRLTDRSLEPVFGRLCQDLYEEAASISDDLQLINLFMERLTLWKLLFEQGNGLLPAHEIMGLIGELLVLEGELQAGRPAHETVSAWQGPLKRDQDFRFDDSAIEVKTTRPDSQSVSISSLDQLVADVPLSLAVLRIRPASSTDSAAVTLSSIVLRLEGRISPSPQALKLFRFRLLEARYVENEKYDELHFQPISRTDYSVHDSFPRLTRAGMPPGISDATYVLDLNTIKDFAIGTTAYDK